MRARLDKLENIYVEHEDWLTTLSRASVAAAAPAFAPVSYPVLAGMDTKPLPAVDCTPAMRVLIAMALDKDIKITPWSAKRRGLDVTAFTEAVGALALVGVLVPVARAENTWKLAQGLRNEADIEAVLAGVV